MAARTVTASPFAHLFHARLRHVLGGSAALALGLTSGCAVRDTCQEDPGGGVLTVQDIAPADQWFCEGGTRYALKEVRDSELGDDGQVCAELYYEPERASGSPCAPPTPLPPGAVEGRPLMVAGEARIAHTRPGDGWVVQGLGPLGLELSEGERRWLGARWRRAARYEHASVASFARFTLDLMRFGAPPELLAAAQTAAADEVRHAAAAFALARRFDGLDEEPGALDLGATLELSPDLAAFAEATFREGCVGETLAALRAAEQRSVAREPDVQAALDALVREEGEHAELAWRTVAWALREGGAPVRDAVRRAAATCARELEGAAAPAQDPSIRPAALAPYGVLSPSREARALSEGWRRVIAPALAAVLAEQRV
jgi:hypothetical protein